MSLAAGLDLELVRRVEAHALEAWPATVVEEFGGGWLLRATPGLSRGRSSHALTPPRVVSREELEGALARVLEFAGVHGIRPGVQVSPLELHGWIAGELVARGWRQRWPVRVLGSSVESVVAGGPGLELVVLNHADPEWLSTWALCEARPEAEVEAHASTVFAGLRGRAMFGRFGNEAAGIVVEAEGLAGLFSLAVAPAVRRRGLGSALVRGLLECCRGAELAYLQVEESNVAGLGLYDRLGFERLYSYAHCVAG